jgi:hypothetical protein
MFTYLWYLFGLLSFYFFIYLDGHKVISSQISLRYQRWRSLNSLVSTQHRTAWAVFYHSLYLLCRVLYISFLQYMNSAVVKIERNKFLVTYVISGKTYTMVVKPIRGPSPVLQVINDSEEDVTNIVLPHLGPRYDWHGAIIEFGSTFGSENLTFNLASGDVVTCRDSSSVSLEASGVPTGN